MKILKLLNKKFYFVLVYLFLGLNCLAEDQPADIWNINKEVLLDNSVKKEVKPKKKRSVWKKYSNRHI